MHTYMYCRCLGAPYKACRTDVGFVLCHVLSPGLGESRLPPRLAFYRITTMSCLIDTKMDNGKTCTGSGLCYVSVPAAQLL
jgi:hypothetical protein